MTSGFQKGNTAGLKHGSSRTPEYRCWIDIKSRCLNPDNDWYSHYGERGVKICDRWRDSFELFLADVGKRPSSRHSIDRFPNNDGNYEPGNVRWATSKQQINNRRNTRTVVLGGKSVPITDAIETLGLSRKLILGRIDLGWSPERAIRTPPLWRRPDLAGKSRKKETAR